MHQFTNKNKRPSLYFPNKRPWKQLWNNFMNIHIDCLSRLVSCKLICWAGSAHQEHKQVKYWYYSHISRHTCVAPNCSSMMLLQNVAAHPLASAMTLKFTDCGVRAMKSWIVFTESCTLITCQGCYVKVAKKKLHANKITNISKPRSKRNLSAFHGKREQPWAGSLGLKVHDRQAASSFHQVHISYL